MYVAVSNDRIACTGIYLQQIFGPTVPRQFLTVALQARFARATRHAGQVPIPIVQPCIELFACTGQPIACSACIPTADSLLQSTEELTELNIVSVGEVRELCINTAMCKGIVWELVDSVDFVACIPHVWSLGGYGT